MLNEIGVESDPKNQEGILFQPQFPRNGGKSLNANTLLGSTVSGKQERRKGCVARRRGNQHQGMSGKPVTTWYQAQLTTGLAGTSSERLSGRGREKNFPMSLCLLLVRGSGFNSSTFPCYTSVDDSFQWQQGSFIVEGRAVWHQPEVSYFGSCPCHADNRGGR